MEMGETGDVGRRTGMFMSILALGALTGPPISGAINTATGSFKPVGYYAGTLYFIHAQSGCVLIWCPARYSGSGRSGIDLLIALPCSPSNVGQNINIDIE